VRLGDQRIKRLRLSRLELPRSEFKRQGDAVERERQLLQRLDFALRRREAGVLVRDSRDEQVEALNGVEGLEAGRWALIDLGDVIVHVFEEAARDTYDLDGLWVDARQIPMEELGLTPHGLLPGEARPNVDRSLLEPDDEDLSDELDPDLEGLEYIDEDGDLDQDDDLGEDEDLDEDEALDEDELDEDEALDEDELDEDELDEDAATDEQAR
jgi:hypothetical protein